MSKTNCMKKINSKNKRENKNRYLIKVKGNYSFRFFVGEYQ